MSKLFFFIVMNFIVFSTNIHCYVYELTICAIFHDEAPYMQEWIEFHKIVGVQHFILYNNNSTDDYLNVLTPYIEEGIVELIEWPSFQKDKDWNNFCFNIQPNAYTDAINKTKNISKWLALIDTDEFIVPVLDKTILECLENRYSSVSGLGINWQYYGTSDVDCIKKDFPLIGQLIYKMETKNDWNRFCKIIVQPLHVLKCINPHLCLYHPGYEAVDTHFRPCNAHTKTVEVDILRINHYWTRDKWFLYNIKIPRYEKWGSYDTSDILERANQMNVEFDDIMNRFVSEVQINLLP